MRRASERSAGMSRPAPDAGRKLAIRTLAVDLQTAQVMSALAARGVDALLLKGPTIARLLYGDGEQRDYVDTDVLVAPPMCGVAEDVLRELGYKRDVGERSMALVGNHGYAWRRPTSRIAVDLHHRLPGVAAPAPELWESLRPYTVSVQMLGATIAALSAPALAFHMALHAAQHGVRGEKSLRDLGRALDRVNHDEWVAAAALAEQVDATDAFGTGLRMLPAGAALANQLCLPTSKSRRVTMVAMGAPPVALMADRLRKTPGTGAKATLLWAKILPPADVVRLQWPLARKGRAGLMLIYPWRLVVLAAQVAPSVIAWRRAGRVIKARQSNEGRW